MKRLFLLFALLIGAYCTQAQNSFQKILHSQKAVSDSVKEIDSTIINSDTATKVDEFIFTTIQELPITSIKNQYRSGTCWSFSSMAFFESELLRMNKGSYDFSEMFVVHHSMVDRAVQYVRLHGDNSFSPGGSFYDALFCLKNYGLVPQSVMPGIMYGDTLPVHDELDAVAGAYVNAIAKGERSKLTPVWKQGLERIYDTYLGECPETFEYNGKNYSPISFAESLGLHAEDYVSITSFSHHPFYSPFILEIQDNWRLASSYNLPMDEMMSIIDHAIEAGYTVLWGADVSEKGFTRDGIGVVPDVKRGAEITGTDMARWTKYSESEKKQELTSRPLPEMEITQEMRQTAFDNWESTDDHGMLIYGIAQDQNGKKYYMVKNSWGTDSKYHGTWYISEAFVRYKTINYVVNKNTLPKDIAKKLGIK